MKTSCIRLAAILCCCCCCGTLTAAQTGGDLSEASICDAVLATNSAMLAAANRLDTDAFFAFLVPDAPAPVVQSGVVFASVAEAKASVVNGLRGIKQIDRRIEHPVVTVLSPDAALLVGEGTVTAVTDDGRQFTNRFAVSLVFVRNGDRWRVLHGHYSAVPPR